MTVLSMKVSSPMGLSCHDSPDAGSKCVKYFLTSTFCRQLSVVLDRELSVDFDRPLSFLQNRAPIILNRPISFFGFIHFENAKKGKIKQLI